MNIQPRKSAGSWKKGAAKSASGRRNKTMTNAQVRAQHVLDLLEGQIIDGWCIICKINGHAPEQGVIVLDPREFARVTRCIACGCVRMEEQGGEVRYYDEVGREVPWQKQ